MNAKRNGSGRTSKNDALPPRPRVKRKADIRVDSVNDTPEVSDRWIAEADLMQGPVLVRRGRPPAADPKRLLSLRIPATVIARWKASGPGWQTRMIAVLSRAAPKHGARP